MKKRLIKTGIIFTVVCMAGICYGMFYSVTGKGIPCIFRMVTGFLCPGCGATRMCVSILQGNFREAMNYNVALFFLSPFIIYILVSDIVQYIKNGKYYHKKWQDFMMYIIIGLLILFSIIRNIGCVILEKG